MTEEDTMYEDVIEWRLVWDGKKLVKPWTNSSASSYEAFGY